MKITVPDLDTPATRPCLQGSVPRRYVDARGVEDVQKTLRFARDKELRLAVKNTGHDYLGRSSAPDSFALWYVVSYTYDCCCCYCYVVGYG